MSEAADPSEPRDPPSGRWSAALWALALAALTFVLYWPTRGAGFVDYDDGAYVTQNPDVNAGLTLDGLRWAFTAHHSANWHPLTWLSHMLDCELFGLDAGAHHLVGAGLHALNAALCLLALRALSRRLLPSVVVAALFAFHPLRVESVAWISERKDVLSGTFFFLTLLAYARYARAPSWGRHALVALGLALGLLAKQMLVTLPVVLLLLDRWPLERQRAGARARLLFEKLPLFALALAAGAVTVVAQRAGDALRTVESLPVGVRVANAVLAAVAYPWKHAWPTDLAVFYPHPWLVAPDSFSVLGPRVLGAAALLVGVTLLAVRLRARRPELLVGWAWYLVMLLPVVGIVQVGAQWRADRYAYLTLVGVYVAVCFSIDRAVRTPRSRRLAFATGLALAVAPVPLTRAQIATWQTTRTLFERALDVTDHNYVAHINLGLLEHKEGHTDVAERHYRAALEVAPRMPDAHNNLGALLLATGRPEEARRSLERAVALNPRYTEARMLLGMLHENQGDPAGALAAYRAAVDADPSSVDALLGLARALEARGESEEALDCLRRAVASQPNHAMARVRLGQFLARSGDARAAAPHLEQAVARAAPPAEALEELAWLLATTADEAVRDPGRAYRMARALGTSWTALRARAAAYAAVGEHDAAYKAALDAALAAPPDEQAELTDLIRRFKAKEALFR